MKTPREILFEHHRQAEAQLDAVRRNALATLSGPAATEHAVHRSSRRKEAQIVGGHELECARAGISGIFKKSWLELIWPARRAWAGIAALWLVVLAVHLGSKPVSPGTSTAWSAPSREVARGYEEQRRLLAELLTPFNPPPPASARPVPSPRSERLVPFKAC